MREWIRTTCLARLTLIFHMVYRYTSDITHENTIHCYHIVQFWCPFNLKRRVRVPEVALYEYLRGSIVLEDGQFLPEFLTKLSQFCCSTFILAEITWQVLFWGSFDQVTVWCGKTASLYHSGAPRTLYWREWDFWKTIRWPRSVLEKKMDKDAS